MADTIKIGNLDISSFKVGSGDCKIYLGETLVYSGGTTPTPTGATYQWVSYSQGDSLPSGDVYGIRFEDTADQSYGYIDFVGQGTSMNINGLSGTWEITVDETEEVVFDDGVATILFEDYGMGASQIDDITLLSDGTIPFDMELYEEV